MFIVKEMKQKRRSSILETVVTRRFSTHLGGNSSPKSSRKFLLKTSLSSQNSISLGADSATLLEDDASPKLPCKEDTSNNPDQKVENAPDQKVRETRWSITDLPSLQLHNQNLPTLVGMLEQVSYSSGNIS